MWGGPPLPGHRTMAQAPGMNKADVLGQPERGLAYHEFYLGTQFHGIVWVEPICTALYGCGRILDMRIWFWHFPDQPYSM